MPRTDLEWTITEAFDKFGFDDGDGPNFTARVAAAIQAAGPYECDFAWGGLHNHWITRITITGGARSGETFEFDGYELPAWDTLPLAIRQALIALNDGEPLEWSL